MNNCGTCKYWDTDDGASVKGLQKCRGIPELWEAEQWNYDCSGNEIKPEFQDKRAFAKDGSDYTADVYTFADFGCTHWEQKEPS